MEIQVRYHPLDRYDGDIGRWLAYVRRVVRAFGPIRHVTGLQITNEVNITFSKNTSDGAYRRSVEALVRGVIEAKRTSRRLGYRHQSIGFNYAWRSAGATASDDARFWSAVGRRGGSRLRRATDWVGLDIYPGTFTPGVLYPLPVVNLGDAFLEGLAQMRECYMPRAGFGRATPIRVEETGYPTGPGRTEATQKRALTAFVRTAVAYRGTYGISDFRWFGLRDNNSRGPDLPVLLRAAARRLLAEAGLRGLPAPDRALRPRVAPLAAAATTGRGHGPRVRPGRARSARTRAPALDEIPGGRRSMGAVRTVMSVTWARSNSASTA